MPTRRYHARSAPIKDYDSSDSLGDEFTQQIANMRGNENRTRSGSVKSAPDGEASMERRISLRRTNSQKELRLEKASEFYSPVPFEKNHMLDDEEAAHFADCEMEVIEAFVKAYEDDKSYCRVQQLLRSRVDIAARKLFEARFYTKDCRYVVPMSPYRRLVYFKSIRLITHTFYRHYAKEFIIRNIEAINREIEKCMIKHASRACEKGINVPTTFTVIDANNFFEIGNDWNLDRDTIAGLVASEMETIFGKTQVELYHKHGRTYAEFEIDTFGAFPQQMIT